ncbi:NAD/NADP-dependent octopine/nopaline dehydrogenase family protein [Rhodoplanes roseus]|uniref:2-dehydropantoate 2-reductase n=1 Tax=Rhodoplanes roseus TaxID=29409 RepID=A0A327KKK0_9BRAD|nr:NAD/NADP-dependent octopine/nopaline dehydrogenase family protein [Rhodoplanes roseus]RAI39350.1 hypothetical protein CH341_26020 [Rhodoplanes roseus]
MSAATDETPPIRRIAIIGAGNGGCAAAADFSLRGYEVGLYGRTPATVAPLQAAGGVAYEGVLGDGFVPVHTITTNAAEAMDGADAVLIMGPTQAHQDIAALIAPHLAPDQILFAAPGHTLTLIPHTLRRHGHARPVTCETTTLPYICRKVSPERVKISRRPAVLKFAAFPARERDRLASRMRELFPAITPLPTLLDTVFPYTNAVHHPPALLCNIGRVESTGGDYFHYYDGITPSVGRMIDALDAERLAVAAAFGCTVDPLPDYFFQIGYTNAEGHAGGTAYSTFHNSEPNRWIRAPETVDHRFFNEDIPYGLVPLLELGRLAGLPMPVSEAVVTLATVVTGKPYRETGLTLQRMGIADLDVAALRRLLDRGWD